VEPAETLAVPTGSDGSDQKQCRARQSRELNRCEPWADDPAEWQNWAPIAEPIAWTDRPDVVAVVEDLSDERMRPRKIAATLGLTSAEVIEILRRTGR
jgi:hypothetical protein